MKCPKCGAQLQENAQFCFYCMHSLVVKAPVNPPNKEKKTVKWLLWIAAVLLSVGALVTTVICIRSPSATENQDAIIATFDDFQLRATYLTGKEGLSALWDPDGLHQTHTNTDHQGDSWQVYSTGVLLDDADLRVCFCEGGTEIILALTDLHEEDLEEGLQIISCGISSVYNYTYTNLHAILTDHDLYPAKEIDPDERILLLANLPDVAGDKIDQGTDPLIIRKSVLAAEDQLMYVEIRTRTYKGSIYYDIVILHTVIEQ